MNAVATTVIFDADDTLWETQPLYASSKDMFFEQMLLSGFPLEDTRTRFENIDHANVLRLGFSKKRFPQSMCDTYRALCADFGRPVDKRMARLVQRIGLAVFEKSPIIIDGVREVLSELKRSDVRLLLATKGDREVQDQRLRTSGLQTYFSRIQILEEKGISEFKQLISEEHIDPAHGWSVGNSVRSDINPALAAGLSAIWIPRETWVYEKATPTPSNQLHVARSIREVPTIVRLQL